MSGCSSSRSLGDGPTASRTQSDSELGRDRSTVHRELAALGRSGRAMTPARRTRRRARGRDEQRTPKLATTIGCWPNRRSHRASEFLEVVPYHATAADLREAGMSVCAETIYRACYANDPRLAAWRRAPWATAARGNCAAPSSRAVSSTATQSARARWGNTEPGSRHRPDRRRGPYRARPLGRRPHRRQSEPHRRGHARRAHQPLRRSPQRLPRRLRRAAKVAAAVTAVAGDRQPTERARAQPHLGHHHHRETGSLTADVEARARHRGVLLRAALSRIEAATHQRAHQRAAAPTGSPKAVQPRHRTTAAESSHRGRLSTTCPAELHNWTSGSRHLALDSVATPIEGVPFTLHPPMEFGTSYNEWMTGHCVADAGFPDRRSRSRHRERSARSITAEVLNSCESHESDDRVLRLVMPFWTT